MQCPEKFSVDVDEIAWSERLESIRKDVECTFGILKRRFRFLASSIQLHDIDCINAAVFTCFILHNMLLSHDAEAAEENADVAGQAADDTDCDEGESEVLRRHNQRVEERRKNQLLQPRPIVSAAYAQIGKQSDASFLQLRKMLVKSFKFQNQAGAVVWRN